MSSQYGPGRLLKDVDIKAASERSKELMGRGEFMTLCKEKGEITFDVLKESLPAAPLMLQPGMSLTL